jgi:two-component system LytT family response regulator
MIKAILIDDEPLARSMVKEYLLAHPEINVIAECNDGFEGIKAIAQYQPDLIFLDIQMPKINGFEMLELIDNPPAVIFTTAFDEYAIKAFEAHAVDYLLKPYSQERFSKAIRKWLDRQLPLVSPRTKELVETAESPDERNRVVVKKGTHILIIPVQKIHYLEAYDDYVKIHTADGFHLKKKTMNHYEGSFDPSQFVRVHRSYMINLQELTRIEPMEKDSHVALLKSGVRIPLSHNGYARLREILGI